MTQIYDDAVKCASFELDKFIALELYEWFGPVAFVLMQELKISIGPHQLEYGSDPVLNGHNTVLPKASVSLLFNAATLHFEGHKLARHVVADLVYGGEPMPEKIRILAKLMLTECFPIPKKNKVKGRRLPSSKHFLRDFAFCHTLSILKDAYLLAPTSNKATSKLNGPAVVKAALEELKMSRNNENAKLVFFVEEATINAAWGKRNVFSDLNAEVARVLGQCTSTL